MSDGLGKEVSTALIHWRPGTVGIAMSRGSQYMFIITYIRIILKPCQREPKSPGLTVLPPRRVKFRAVPANILQPAVVDFACKERVLAQSRVIETAGPSRRKTSTGGKTGRSCRSPAGAVNSRRCPNRFSRKATIGEEAAELADYCLLFVPGAAELIRIHKEVRAVREPVLRNAPCHE
jgi:hypothetical protein